MIHNCRNIMLAAMMGAATVASAQDTYDANNIMASDLNGTARFVSMGGALGALGGDISVMSTNPAGTALYRKSNAVFTLGGVITRNDGAMGRSGSKASLDQAGALFTFNVHNPGSKGLQYVNFGVNYQKSRNFFGNQAFNIQNLNGKLSQTFQIADLANYCQEVNYWGTLANMSAPVYNDDGSLYRPGIIEYDQDYKEYYGIGADKASYERATFGGSSEVNINLSFNNSDRFFYGLSFGVYDVSYTRESFYKEIGIDGFSYDFTNWYKTRGQGFDIKFGFICRPIEESPFRFGVNIHTPTWYGLTDSNGSSLYLNDSPLETGWVNSNFDYRFRTPWKFGLNLGHTFGNKIALGAEWEFQDQGSATFSNAAGDYNASTRDYFRQVNQINKETLKMQHTLKLGLEFKPVNNFAIRAGYNYVSSPFKDGAFRTITPEGPYTETDYTNWKGINRFTVGLGYFFKGGHIDIAYQYQKQNGDFYAFDNYDGEGSVFTLRPTSINNDFSHIMGTLGIRF